MKPTTPTSRILCVFFATASAGLAFGQTWIPTFEMELRTGNIRAIDPVWTLLPPSGGPGVHLGYMVPLPPAKNQMNQPWKGACK